MQLVFDAPICATPGDAFIARDAQALHTIGGGIVIDPYAPARRRRSSERLGVLDSIERLLAGEGVDALLRNAPQGIAMRELARLCGCPPERIAMPSGVRMIDAAGERFACSNRIGAQWASGPWLRCRHFTRSSRTSRASIARAFAA